MSAKLFSGAFQKIERAKQHIAELESILTDFRKTHPYELSVKPDIQHGCNIIDVILKEPLPHTIPATIGDAAHNLRASLDHIVWELVTSDGGTPGRHTEFPFDETKEKFEAAADRKVRGAKAETIQLIKDTKAFRGGNGALWGLNCLDRIDKHRHMIATVAATSLSNFTVKNAASGRTMGTFGHLEVSYAESGKGMISMGPGLYVELNQNSKTSVDILFARGIEVFQHQPVIPTLAQLSQAVAGVVETFRAISRSL